MEAEQQKIKDHFSKHLKAADYVYEMSECWKDAPELFRFMIEFIHDAFSSGKLNVLLCLIYPSCIRKMYFGVAKSHIIPLKKWIFFFKMKVMEISYCR